MPKSATGQDTGWGVVYDEPSWCAVLTGVRVRNPRHRGHRRVLRRVTMPAAAAGLHPGVGTQDPRPMQTSSIRAHAKVNLYLEVLGRRADGFHRLETVFQSIALHDVITLRHDPQGFGITLACDDPGIPADATNLVWRAVAAYTAGRAEQA